MYFPGVISLIKGDTPFLDGVATGRGLAAMFAALANGGRIDGKTFLSDELARGLAGRARRKWPDANMVVPMAFHLGYHESPVLFDMGSFAGLARPLCNAIEAVRDQGPLRQTRDAYDPMCALPRGSVSGRSA